MARFGRSFPMPYSGYYIPGAFGEEISQLVILESSESFQILNPLTMTMGSGFTVDVLESSSAQSYIVTGLDMAVSWRNSSVTIYSPISPPPFALSSLKMTTSIHLPVSETVSFELPPGKWKRPKDKKPRPHAWNALGEYEDTEYEVGIDFAPIISTSASWTVSSLTLRDTIYVRSEQAISQDTSAEGKP